jgi:hypothetical protein
MRVPQHYRSDRQRFAAAHELAHLLLLENDNIGVRRPFELADLETLTPKQKRYRERVRLEALCDFIARVMLVPSKFLPPIGSTYPSLGTFIDLARTFDVPISVIFERLIDEGQLSRYPGWVLLRYGTNEFTDADPKWRVAGRAIPRAEMSRFPKVNQGLANLKLDLAAPSKNVRFDAGEAWEFVLGGRKWTLRCQDFGFWMAAPLLLASIAFSTDDRPASREKVQLKQPHDRSETTENVCSRKLTSDARQSGVQPSTHWSWAK